MLVALEPQCVEISDCVFEGRNEEDIGAGDQVQYSGSRNEHHENETNVFTFYTDKASGKFAAPLNNNNNRI